MKYHVSVKNLMRWNGLSSKSVLRIGQRIRIYGGGGLGKIAINYGYYRYKTLVMILAVLLLILIVQLLQTVGTRLAVKSNKRLKK